MMLNYEKTFEIEIINELSASVYNRVLNDVLNHELDTRNTQLLAVNLLNQLELAQEMDLFNLSLNELKTIHEYWRFMNQYSKQVLVKKYDMENVANFNEQQFEERLEKNIARLTKNKVAIEKPTAFLLGGQPGSGKTGLRLVIAEETHKNVIVIDNDTFKQQHPNFDALSKKFGKDVVEQVTPFSNRMTESLVEQLSNCGYNLVIEGTGRTTEVPIKTAEMLQAKGYQTKMYVMAVPEIESYLGTIERYETMYADEPLTARATPKKAHDIVVQNFPNNLETLHKRGMFTDIRLYNRQGEKLYSSLELPFISPKDILDSELNRRLSGEVMQPTLGRIKERMIQNNHQETSEFQVIKQKLEDLKSSTLPKI